MELTLQPGHSLQKQLDPAEVAARRSLVGSRYDQVDQAQYCPRISQERAGAADADRSVERQAGEVKSLFLPLQTKYALKGYDIEAASGNQRAAAVSARYSGHGPPY